MSTRRSLFTLVAVALMMVASAASAMAQTVDQTPATDPAGVEAFVAAPTASGTTYDGTKLTWTIAPGYKANCTDGNGGTCAMATQTPLTSVTVYYSTKTFKAVTEAAVMSMPADKSGVAVAHTTGGEAVLEGLKPSTQYFVRLAAANAHSTADKLCRPPMSPRLRSRRLSRPSRTR